MTKYIDPLPNPLSNIIAPSGTLDRYDFYEVSMTQFSQQLHSELPPTTLWGYNGTYPGPTFDVDSNVPIKVEWTNNLVDGMGMPLSHLLPYDTTVHGAGPQFPEARTVAHLHGGVVEPESDGFPEYWFTPDPLAAPNGMGGPAGNSVVYTYHNEQPASTLWYHDHSMGITRLNVYAGMAGFYILRDEQEAALNLPSGAYEVPLVFQDRSFYDDGQLYYPRGPGDVVDPGGPDPLAGLPPEFPSDASVVPHFFGDTNLVNGVVWPVMDVEPRKYRFRMLNGANSRFYDLQLDAGTAGTLPFYQIGTEGGLLAATTDRDDLLMAPAERADVIVDFSSLTPGDEVFLRNFAPDGVFQGPLFPQTPADPNTTGQVMKFRVVEPTGPDTSSLPETLVPVPRIPESDAVATRQLSLVADVDEYGRPKLLLDGAKWTDPTTELPVQGTTEIWEITNSTIDSHPIHLHLVQFQVLDRVSRDVGEIPLEDYELGWKDTVMVNRRETVRVIAKFEDFEGLYVWHCHILEHEDHEMMRRYEVVPGPELLVEAGVTLALDQPHVTPAGYTLTVDGTLTAPQVDVEGLLRGTGQVQAPVVNRGVVSPGDSPGVLSVDAYTQEAAGRLRIELGGTDNGNPPAPEFDQLQVTGNAVLAGTLDVELVDGFEPAFGDTFDILTATSVAGRFDVTKLPDVAEGLGWNVDYQPDRVTLVVWLPGDGNLDGVVDGLDYLLWAGNYGDDPADVPPGAPGNGDYNDDGVVDGLDYLVWASNFGATIPATAVPEPSAALLALFGVTGLCLLGRRTSGHRERQEARNAYCRSETTPRNLDMGKLALAALLATATLSVAAEVRATMVTLSAMKDNTLIETSDGSLSNGIGSYLFAGDTDMASNAARRAVMAFDIAGNVPPGSVIQSASLTLRMSRTKVGTFTFDLHRLTANWGEGTSNADGQEGGGDTATTGDATWLHTFYPGSTWTNVGGDFAATVSASLPVGGNGFYTWGSTTQLVADVQSWVDNPATNFGWILIGPENERAAKRFNSRENSDGPSLVLEFVSGGPETYNWIGTGSGGSWQDAGNWDTGVAPIDPSDIVYLVNNDVTDQTATLTGSVTIDNLTIDGNTNSMMLSIAQGQQVDAGDLTIGSMGGLGAELASGTSGRLNAAGPASLAGTLALSTPGGTPGLADTFEFLSYGSRTGLFDAVVGREIEPGRSFSLHYNDSRVLAIAGEWMATAEELAGDVDVLDDLSMTGAWTWNDTLIKRGTGELVIDLDGGFSAGAGATLAIVEGTVALRGTDQTLSLDALVFGDLGAMSGIAELAGQFGWYGSVLTVPEPNGLALLGVAVLGWGVRWRTRRPFPN
ncbi:MAG: multicopper oxidase domain-containing protein [Pirellulales bacterium]